MTILHVLEGRYELHRRVGRGGMAEVFRGVERGEDGVVVREVAIKRMAPGLSSESRFERMFLEEARVIAALQHANIAEFHRLCHDADGELYLVVEWVEGADMSQAVDWARASEERFDWRDVVAIVRAIASALSAAHERKEAAVYHRDVTPSNILLGVDGRAVLTDFGLARAMDRVTMTTPGAVVGKLAYVAPELVGNGRPGPGSDIYSLGIVAWEALAGRRLYNPKNDMELFVLVGKSEVPPIASLRPDVPGDLAAIVRQMTSRAPQHRFERASALVAALDSLAVGERRDEIAVLARRVRDIYS